MAFLDRLLGAGLVAVGAKFLFDAHEENKKKLEEEKKRKASVCYFADGITENEFDTAVYKESKKIKRVTIESVCGPVIKGYVRSQSGLSTWDFELDFNDYGHITGRYWCTQDNDDSRIPEILADNIKAYVY